MFKNFSRKEMFVQKFGLKNCCSKNNCGWMEIEVKKIRLKKKISWGRAAPCSGQA